MDTQTKGEPARQYATTAQNMPVEDCAQALVELFNLNGVRYIFYNVGTDTFPVLEAICRMKSRGEPTPEIISCPHEYVAMTAAHGYYMLTGKPQVVMVHCDVGAQQIGGGLHNAQRARAGVVVFTGYPSGFTGDEKLGGKDNYSAWPPEQLDAAGTFRNYVKWYYELRSPGNIHTVVQRAFQVAATEPAGPVFLTISRDLLMEKVSSVQFPPVTEYSIAESGQPDAKILKQIAEWLTTAQLPLTLAGNSGRNTSTVEPLVKLAETIGMRVISSGNYLNFPSNHPCWGDRTHLRQVSKADVLLIIDHDVPYLPHIIRPRPDAKIIYIDIDAVKASMPLWHFPATLRLQADSKITIPALLEEVNKLVNPAVQATARKRLEQISKESADLRKQFDDFTASKAKQTPISLEYLCDCLGRELKEDDILISEVISGFGNALRYYRRNKPGTLFRCQGGISLGFGTGAAIGAKLAAPDKLVVLAEADGCFIFSSPTAALWTARVHKIPFLTVIFNNQVYNAPRRDFKNLCGDNTFLEKMASEQGGNWLGMSLSPSPEYSLIAEANGAKGMKVEDPALLPQAIKKAIEMVRGGEIVVMDVRIGQEWAEK
jgi:acetolactate synthase I/II/III large subunit